VPEIDGRVVDTGTYDDGGGGGGGGGGGAGAAFDTVTVTVEDPVRLPFVEYAFAVSWWVPLASAVVFNPPATPLYSQGATCSVHLTVPSTAKST
jgi:hypothetical protein